MSGGKQTCPRSPRLEREAQYVEEGPRLADYGIVPESGLELGNPVGLED